MTSWFRSPILEWIKYESNTVISMTNWGGWEEMKVMFDCWCSMIVMVWRCVFNSCILSVELIHITLHHQSRAWWPVTTGTHNTVSSWPFSLRLPNVRHKAAQSPTRLHSNQCGSLTGMSQSSWSSNSNNSWSFINSASASTRYGRTEWIYNETESRLDLVEQIFGIFISVDIK